MELLIQLSNQRVFLLDCCAQFLELCDDSITVMPVFLHFVEQPVNLLLVSFHFHNHFLAFRELVFAICQRLKLILQCDNGHLLPRDLRLQCLHCARRRTASFAGKEAALSGEHLLVLAHFGEKVALLLEKLLQLKDLLLHCAKLLFALLQVRCRICQRLFELLRLCAPVARKRRPPRFLGRNIVHTLLYRLGRGRCPNRRPSR
mmetsp:Transcript_57814/g.93567  ORF Transcript_57814/g.93567 Transcript_57814/m.93567 type:complete len:203 (-) Transcript_57814:899-1507(-)